MGTLFSSSSWQSKSWKDLACDLHPFEKPSQALSADKLNLLKNQGKLELYKLISPAQCLNHVWRSHAQGNTVPPSVTLHPFPYGKFPRFRGCDDLLPAVKFGPLGTYLFDDLSCVDGKRNLSGLSLEPDFSKRGHQSVYTTSDRLSVDEFLVDALKGSVILGEPRNLAGLAKTWKGGGLGSKECLEEIDGNEGVLLLEVSLHNKKTIGASWVLFRAHCTVFQEVGKCSRTLSDVVYLNDRFLLNSYFGFGELFGTAYLDCIM